MLIIYTYLWPHHISTSPIIAAYIMCVYYIIHRTHSNLTDRFTHSHGCAVDREIIIHTTINNMEFTYILWLLITFCGHTRSPMFHILSKHLSHIPRILCASVKFTINVCHTLYVVWSDGSDLQCWVYSIDIFFLLSIFCKFCLITSIHIIHTSQMKGKANLQHSADVVYNYRHTH